MNKNNWYEDFFEGPFLDVQQNFLSAEETKAEVEFIIDALSLKPNQKVLDIPCGLGRLTVELADFGCKMTGLDFTESYLEVCQKVAEDRKFGITLHKGDMRKPPWKNEFDAAICVGGSFGYFDDDENYDFIKSVYQTLKPGGRFMVYAHVAESLFPMFVRKDWRRVGKSIILDDRSYDVETDRINSEWTIINGNKTTVQYSSMRIYRYSDIRNMLNDVGFGNLKGYGSVAGEPFEFRSKILYLVGVKN